MKNTKTPDQCPYCKTRVYKSNLVKFVNGMMPAKSNDIGCHFCNPPRYKNKKWTMTMVRESAKKRKSRMEWFKKDPDAYNAARRHGWLDIVAPASKRKRWTLEKCKEEALKYKSLPEWRSKNPASLQAAYRRGLVNKNNKNK